MKWIVITIVMAWGLMWVKETVTNYCITFDNPAGAYVPEKALLKRMAFRP